MGTLDEFQVVAAQHLPRVAGVLLLVVAGLLVARLTRSLGVRFFSRLGRFLVIPRLHGRVDLQQIDRTATLISRILYWTILIIFLLAAAELLGMPVLSRWSGGLSAHLPRVLGAILILVTGIIVSLIARDIVSTGMTAAGVSNPRAISRVVQFALLLAVVLIAADQLGINVSFLTNGILLVAAAFLLGAALAFGLGARSQVSNILASYSVQKLYSLGQRIRVGEHEGRIVEILPMAVLIETERGRLCLPARLFAEQESMLVFGAPKHDD